jgi:hypothetical protein
MRIDLGPANHHAGVCISRTRWLSLQLREILRKENIWEDLIQELYAAAFFAWKQGMDDAETRRYASRCLYAFMKAYGFRMYRGGYHKFEKELSTDNLNGDIPDVVPYSAIFRFDNDHLEDKILDYLKKHPEGLSRRMFCAKFQIPVQEVSLYMFRLIQKGFAVEIKRENTRGRPLTPLLVALEPGQVLPKPAMVKTAQTERIRHAYFAERKSIKQVAREFHHDRGTVRKAIKH